MSAEGPPRLPPMMLGRINPQVNRSWEGRDGRLGTRSEFMLLALAADVDGAHDQILQPQDTGGHLGGARP